MNRTKPFFLVAMLLASALGMAQQGSARQLVARQARAWEKQDFTLAASDWLPTAVLVSPEGNTAAAQMPASMKDYFKDRMVQARLVEHAASPLDVLIRVMVDGMIEVHAPDPELYQLLQAEVPHRADGTPDFALRLEGAFRLALSSHMDEVFSSATENNEGVLSWLRTVW